MPRKATVAKEPMIEESEVEEPVIEETVVAEEPVVEEPKVKEAVIVDSLSGKEYCGKIIIKSYPININGKELVGVLLDDRSTTIYETELS